MGSIVNNCNNVFINDCLILFIVNIIIYIDLKENETIQVTTKNLILKIIIYFIYSDRRNHRLSHRDVWYFLFRDNL